MYSLVCSYLNDSLQVTRQIPRKDLLHPNLFGICSVWLGLDGWSIPGKFSSGRFRDQAGREVSSNPLEWPEGEAREVEIGPWRFSLAELVKRGDYRRIRKHYPEQEDLARNALAAHHADAILARPDGADQLKWVTQDQEICGSCQYGEADFIRMFSPDGPNAWQVGLLDNADWRIRPEGPAPDLLHGLSRDQSHARVEAVRATCTRNALWFTIQAPARILWNEDRLIEGAYLHRWQDGAETLRHYCSVPDALQALVIAEPSLPPYLIPDVEGATQADQESIQSELESACFSYHCRYWESPTGESHA